MTTTNVRFFGQVYKVTWAHYTDANNKEYIGVDQVNDLPYGLLSEQFNEDITEALHEQLKYNKIQGQKHIHDHD